MKLANILEVKTFDQEGNLETDTSGARTAEILAKQFLRVAAGNTKDTYEPELLAKQLAGAFHQQVLKAIDEELKMKNVGRISAYGPSGSVRAIA